MPEVVEGKWVFVFETVGFLKKANPAAAKIGKFLLIYLC